MQPLASLSDVGASNWWVAATSIFTAISAAALVVGGIAAYLQLRHIRQSRQEELVLELAAVFHDIIPPKRRIAAHLLLDLIDGPCGGTPCDEVDDTQLNAIADVCRFFETVYTTIKAIPAKPDRKDSFSTDAVSLEFGAYAAGYRSAFDRLPVPMQVALLDRALRGRGEKERLFRALNEIVTHAQRRRSATGDVATSNAIDGEARAFLRRETSALSAKELSAAETKSAGGNQIIPTADEG